MSAYVYILECADRSYYTRSTVDLERRLWEHEEGLGPDSYTKTRRPVRLVFCEEFEYILDAAAAERQIKGWQRAKKQALMNSDFDLIIEFAKRYPP